MHKTKTVKYRKEKQTNPQRYLGTSVLLSINYITRRPKYQDVYRRPQKTQTSKSNRLHLNDISYNTLPPKQQNTHLHNVLKYMRNLPQNKLHILRNSINLKFYKSKIHTKYILGLQQNLTGNKQQKDIWEIPKYLKTK